LDLQEIANTIVCACTDNIKFPVFVHPECLIST